MVDLVKAEAAGLGKRGAAERAAALLQLTSRRLSLRDPLAPRRRSGSSDVDIGRSLPCNFTQGRPSLRLGGPGHVSWRTRDEPRYERNCRRVDRFAQAHDSAWLGVAPLSDGRVGAKLVALALFSSSEPNYE